MNVNLKLREMKTLTIKEAVERVNNGASLEGVVLDKSSMLQVNVRDAIILSRGGIVIPEENIYYDDTEIEYDEEIDELVIGKEITGLSWEEKSERFEARQRTEKKVSIDILTDESEIEHWIVKNKRRLGDILKPIVVDLFKAEQMIKGNAPDNG